jgi:hypothetical protein
LRRQQPSRDWSEPFARRRVAPATFCRESSGWQAKDNGPHRLKNDLLLSAKIGFVLFDISGSNLRSLI